MYYLCTATPDISRSGESINNTARVSRSSFRFLWLCSSETANLRLLLTHVETVFRGTPYFAATALFDILFSKSFEVLHFLAKDLFVSFRLTGAIFRNKTSDY